MFTKLFYGKMIFLMLCAKKTKFSAIKLYARHFFIFFCTAHKLLIFHKSSYAHLKYWDVYANFLLKYIYFGGRSICPHVPNWIRVKNNFLYLSNPRTDIPQARQNSSLHHPSSPPYPLSRALTYPAQVPIRPTAAVPTSSARRAYHCHRRRLLWFCLPHRRRIASIPSATLDTDWYSRYLF
jgi:hypothetical protein